MRHQLWHCRSNVFDSIRADLHTSSGPTLIKLTAFLTQSILQRPKWHGWTTTIWNQLTHCRSNVFDFSCWSVHPSGPSIKLWSVCLIYRLNNCMLPNMFGPTLKPLKSCPWPVCVGLPLRTRWRCWLLQLLVGAAVESVEVCWLYVSLTQIFALRQKASFRNPCDFLP